MIKFYQPEKAELWIDRFQSVTKVCHSDKGCIEFFK